MSKQKHSAPQLSPTKKKELRILEQFKKNFTDVPNGELIVQENPDFVIRTADGHLGIEIRQWAPDEDKNGSGSPMLRRESNSDWIVKQAQQIHDKKNPLPLYVSVNFHPGYSPTKRDYIPISEAIASAVEKTIPGTGENVLIRYPSKGWEELPREILSISITRLNAGDSAVWVPEMSGGISTIAASDLEAMIKEKEQLLAKYKTPAKNHLAVARCLRL